MSVHPLGHSAGHTHARRLTSELRKGVLIFWILPSFLAASAYAAELKPETVAAFGRYVAATEAQMGSDPGLDQFLIVDRLADLQRQQAYDQLRGGQVYIEELHTQEDHHPIPIENGLVHHWAGVIFIPKATVSDIVAILQDYENQPSIYKPDVRQAKLIDRNGQKSKIFEQFYSKSLITVVLNVYFDVMETQIGSGRVQSVSRSTRIAEVVNQGEPDEHERNDGKDHGYLWRLNSYWRMEEKDGGVYVQSESLSLTRTVPVMLAWLINPLTKSIPHDVLFRLLTDTRMAALTPGAASKHESLSRNGH
jgi:hypothetical protein